MICGLYKRESSYLTFVCMYARTLNFPEASIYFQINMDENKNAHWTTPEAIRFRICINPKCSLVVLPPW